MRKIVTGLVLFAMYLGVFAPFAAMVSAQNIIKARESKMKDLEPGLKFRLSNGAEGAESRVTQSLAATDPLSQADANGLLKRLPSIKTNPDDKTEFAKRIGSLPAPKNGRMLPVKFPAPDQIDVPTATGADKPLEVLRYSPEGEVPLAPDLSVTFSQPMVAVTSQEDAAKYAPVELTPQVEGRWRWLGTKTLMFDTTKRFPMATKFTARVPGGTKSATGQVLKKDVVWTFTTPPPKVEQMIPQNQTVRRDALMYLQFDQEISPEAVINTITVTGQGKKIPLRLATEAEIAADGSISYYAKQKQPKRWMAFRAVNSDGLTENALPAASPITVRVEKGTLSAEGPLTTTALQNFQFHTYGPFKYNRAYCGWQQNTNCSPFEPWYIEFTNTIDTSKFTKEMVKIEPPVEGLNIYPSGNNIYFQGYKKGNTTYKVTVDGALSDSFSQPLGQPAVATIKVGSAPQSLYAQGGTMSVLDPTAKPYYSIYSTNHKAVKVQFYRVEPKDWRQFQDYVRHINYDDGKRPPIPGTLVSDKVVNIASKPDEMVETRIDLGPVLDGGVGNVIIDVRPLEGPKEPVTVRGNIPRIFSWLQATQIGLDAFVDNEELVGFATDLKTGRPLSGVDLSIFPNGKGAQRSSVRTEEKGFLSELWDWVAGTGGPSASNTESLDTDGTVSQAETIEPAQTLTTGDNGILRIPLPDAQSTQGQNILVAKRGKDVAFLPENSDYYWYDSGNWYKKTETDSRRWFVFDDRRMYKPKEEVAVKGYIRKLTAGKLGDIEGLGGQVLTYTWLAKDPRNNEIAKGTVTTNAFGAFDLKFTLPDNTNLGYAQIEFTEQGSTRVSHSHQFQIQEFRRPEFEVSAKVDSEAPFFVGGKADLSVEAKYYAGGGLANADTNWTVTATPTNYTPPNRGDYTFGTWVPWWGVYDYGQYSIGGRGSYGGITQNFKGVTDADGKHLLKIDFESVNPPRPYSVIASASVQDVNRQTWSSSTTLLVHPADLYVGIKTPRTFVQKGENIEVESIVSDIDGKLISGREIDIKAVLKDWEFDKGAWKEVTVDEQICSVKSPKSSYPTSASADGVVGAKCTFVAKAGGRYTITATVMDDRERFNESEFTIWVPGGKTPPKRNVEQEQVQIIPSKKDFAPGDVAELLVISPFTPAEGVLTLRRDGIAKTERFTMKDSSITLKIPLEEKYLPNIYAQVDLVGAEPRTNDKGEVDEKLSKRPAFASGNINLAISTESRKLTVSAEPRDKTLAPGGETNVDIEVKDQNGEPVPNSEVAVVIVDEGILALSRYTIDDPTSIFYTARGTGTMDYHLRKDVLLGNPEDVKAPPPPPAAAESVDVSDGLPKGRAFTSMLKSSNSARPEALGYQYSINGASGPENSFMVDGQESQSYKKGLIGEDETPIALRENLNALALFSPSVKTDSNGKATVDVMLPDNLTRYRITAVAVDPDKRFGKTESSITAKKPLMVRPSAPRFMNFGDKIDLPVVVQNQTDQDMAVDVAIRATNALLGSTTPSAEAVATPPKTGGELITLGKRVIVKANSREEVRFPVSTVKAGTARFQIAVTSGKYSDGAEILLPVWTPATTEAFATYGTTDQNGAIIQPVQTPGDVYPQFGGLEVTTSSTQLQELTDAYIYLAKYPYECSEQISSRMISTAALRDVLTAFKSKDIPSGAALDAQFKRDMEILQSRQRDDGSFGLWKRDKERYEYPFLTIHVAHALALAKAKGYKVPDEMTEKTRPYLKNVEKHFDEWYRPEVRWTISAYALYVRDMMGDRDIGKTKKLLAEATIEKMPFEGLGWILSVLSSDPGSKTEVDAILHFLNNRTTETAATANFVTNYGDGAWLIMYSNRRADGVLLEAMIKADPKNELIPKLVRGLLDHRVKGAWSNTQENVFILLALDKYFNAFEKVTPDFVTRIWLGGTYAGEEAFKGRSIDSNVLNIPMSYLVDQGGTSNLLLDKQGAGRLYYRIGMKYAPKNLKLDPADYGFTVLRKYEAVDDKDDVKQDADGTWTIKSGARVRVRLTMVAQARRYHVALVDNLPAGLEILNPELATTEVIPPDTGSGNTSVLEVGSRSYGRNYFWWRWNWFEHQNFRDERAEAFCSLLWEGVYNYTYVARATTPGQFVVPPAKAEEMYHPETFGRTGTDLVNVE